MATPSNFAFLNRASLNGETFTSAVLASALLDDKTKVLVREVASFKIEEIVRGILFIYAVWSATSLQSWKTLTRVLEAETDIDFCIYVFDADELTKEFVDSHLTTVPHGSGEAYWIRNGKILHTLARCWEASTNEIKAFTEEVAKD